MPVRRVVSLLAALLLSLSATATAGAAVRYATPTMGSNAAFNCPQSSPCTLRNAVDGAGVGDGDEVVVTAGAYTETGQLTVDHAITVHGGSGFFTPMVETSAASGIRLDDPGARLSDLAIEHSGGDAALTIVRGTAERVRVAGDGASACSLLGTVPGAAILRDSTCLDRGSGGDAIDGSVIGSGQSGGTLRNVSAMAAGTGGSGLNVSASGGGRSAFDVRNAILLGDGDDLRAHVADASSSASVVLSSSNYDPATATGPNLSVTSPSANGNQWVEPVLAGPASGNFTQLSSSPTIDAGTVDAAIGELDVNSARRVQGGGPDIGADEFPDSRPPQTTIQSGPTGRIPTGKPEFGFVSDEPGSTFECRIDAEPFRGCTSPFAADGLTVGDHTFDVRATDSAGNVDPTPAERGFTVDKNVSGANVKAKRSQRQRGRRIVLTVTVRASEEAIVVGRGSIDAGKRRVGLRSRRVEVTAGGSRRIRLSPKRRSDARRVRRTIRRRGRAMATVTAKFTDDLGNQATSGDVSIKLKGRKRR